MSPQPNRSRLRETAYAMLLDLGVRDLLGDEVATRGNELGTDAVAHSSANASGVVGDPLGHESHARRVRADLCVR